MLAGVLYASKGLTLKAIQYEYKRMREPITGLTSLPFKALRTSFSFPYQPP